MGNVRGTGNSLATALANLTGKFIKSLDPACTEDHRCTTLRKQAPRRLADAAACSRDRDDFALDTRHFDPLPSRHTARAGYLIRVSLTGDCGHARPRCLTGRGRLARRRTTKE